MIVLSSVFEMAACAFFRDICKYRESERLQEFGDGGGRTPNSESSQTRFRL